MVEPCKYMEYRMKDRRGKEQTEDDMNTGTAKTELQDEDWKTAIAQKKQTIPAGATVKIIGTLQNMYGDFVKVEYNGVKYIVEPHKIQRGRGN